MPKSMHKWKGMLVMQNSAGFSPLIPNQIMSQLILNNSSSSQLFYSISSLWQCSQEKIHCHNRFKLIQRNSTLKYFFYCIKGCFIFNFSNNMLSLFVTCISNQFTMLYILEGKLHFHDFEKKWNIPHLKLGGSVKSPTTTAHKVLYQMVMT